MTLLDEQEFVRTYYDLTDKGLTDVEISSEMGYTDIRGYYRRKANLSKKYDLQLYKDNSYKPHGTKEYFLDHPFTGVFFSDAHFWPESVAPLSPAYWIMLQIIEHIQPEVIHDGGDSLDGATISRHPRNGFEERPSLVDEIKGCIDAKGLIKDASKDSDLIWSEGNHDSRFNTRIANDVAQFEGLSGFSIDDHFPDWDIARKWVINETLFSSHKWKGGKNAAMNNALWGGISFISGHTHELYDRIITDYNGVRYGISTGTLAWIYGPQFTYTDALVDWQCGFYIIHFDGKTIRPERVHVHNDGTAYWSGKIWKG